MTYYLKYRPQKINELDSSQVRETLQAVLLSKKSDFHAFLFTGPKGLGKTSAARIVAKFLNCENRKASDLPAGRQGLEPCNRCYQCTSITSGSNFDVLEIDAASNRGIDEIRDLRDKINLSTIKAKCKVYIIDEVHMLTAEAFNALLKTLEEPPSHAIFVLCTTEPQKVPATIKSRCLHVSFSLATKDELTRSFKRIVNGEKLNIEKEALDIIADLSGGSFRDGSKILQEVVAKAGNRKVTQDFILKNFKSVAVDLQVSGLISFLEEKDVRKALDLVQKLVIDGVDMKYFVEELVSKLHSELLLKVEEKAQSKFTLEELKKLLELLMNASSQIKYAVLSQLPLELAIVEFTALRSPSDVRGPAPLIPAGARSSLSASGTERTAPPSGTLSRVAPQNQFLNELILKINSENRTIAGLLRGVNLKDMNGKKVVLETRYNFHKEKLDEKNAKSLIEKVASEILKKNVTIDFLLNPKDGD